MIQHTKIYKCNAIKSLKERNHRITVDTCLNIVKAVFSKPIANIILKGEKLKVFPLKPRMRQEYEFSPLLFNTVLKTTVRAVRQNKDMKEMKLRSPIIAICTPYNTILKRRY